jgi:hypothetical protein
MNADPQHRNDIGIVICGRFGHGAVFGVRANCCTRVLPIVNAPLPGDLGRQLTEAARLRNLWARSPSLGWSEVCYRVGYCIN